MAVQIQIRRDLAANWTSANPILAQGEPGYETDTGKIKYGTGTTAWNSLAYSGVVTSQLNAYLQVANAASIYQTISVERAALANTNLAITNVKTGLTSTNTAIRTLVSDRLQVANAASIYQTKAVERAALANTNTFIATKVTGAITVFVANTLTVTTVASSVKLNDAVVVNPAGHLSIVISGTTYKIPYFS